MAPRNFLTAHDLDGLEEYWSGIEFPQFKFAW